MTYEITDLGTLQGDHPVPAAISSSGVVTGLLATSYPFRYQTGTLTQLEMPPNVFAAKVRGISPSMPERIAGTIDQSGSRATIWTDGAYADIQSLIGVAYTEAYDVNDDGVVTGQANGKGFRLNLATKQVELLGLPNGDIVMPYAINKFGHVAGIAGPQFGNHMQLFFWDQAMHIIPTPKGVGAEFLGLNDKDVIAGYVRGVGEIKYAFVYDVQSKVVTNIHGAAFLSSAPCSINNHGVVAGICHDFSNDCAMIWTASDGMRRLIDLVDMQSGWTFHMANAINDAGQITGWGYHNGKPRGYLLTPLPRAHPSHPKEPITKDLVTMIKEIVFAGGGMGIVLPSGDIIYPKGGPIDPDSPLQREDAARSDAANFSVASGR